MKKLRLEDITPTHKNIHNDYEYYKYDVLPSHLFKQIKACVYELPPRKANCPYHYHSSNEELFYILKGQGEIRTPDEIISIQAGDFIAFPTGKAGAHKIYNTSKSESLLYLDFDSKNDIDIAVYPDSNKVGVWDQEIRRIYPMDANVDYYENE